MSKGKVNFRLTKEGEISGIKQKVYVDDKYAGCVDVGKDLDVTIATGNHRVQYKVDGQLTDVVNVNVGEGYTKVECIFEGTSARFSVSDGYGNLEKSTSLTQTNDVERVKITKSQEPIPENTGGGFHLDISRIIVIGIMIISFIPLFSALFGGEFTSDGDIIKEAEKEVKSEVAASASTIPDMESEILEEGEGENTDWAIVLVRYDDGGLAKGSMLVGVKITKAGSLIGSILADSWNYDSEPSESEIEVIKAQWGVE